MFTHMAKIIIEMVMYSSFFIQIFNMVLPPGLFLYILAGGYYIYSCLYLPFILQKPRSGRPTQISLEEEGQLLAEFEARAEAGQVVEVSDIKAAYQDKVGRRIGTGQIYRVLKRHNWRKVKPRSRHPKKASQEVIETSKKLTPVSPN